MTRAARRFGLAGARTDGHGAWASRAAAAALPRHGATASGFTPRLSLVATAARSRPPWVLAAVVAACGPDAAERTGPGGLAPTSADEVTFDVTHVVSVDGVREARLRADSMLAWRDSAHVVLGRMELAIFDEQGRARATITADSGRLLRRTDELTAMGNARLVVAAEDLEISSSILRFAPASDRVWSDSAVVMRKEQCRVEGDRFEADLNFDDVTIGGTQERGCG